MGRDICFGAKVQVKSQDDTERTTSKIPSKSDQFAAKRRKVNKPLQKSLIKSNLSIAFCRCLAYTYFWMQFHSKLLE